VAGHFDRESDLDAALAAILHDTVEKGSFEFDDLRGAGLAEHVLDIVDALTERPDESERDYLARCAAHPTALRIKRVDIADKLPARMDHLDAPTRTRVRANAERRLHLLEDLASAYVH
jgi:(p)ppGpp synthase/HD superfamily hydrolase